MGHKQAAGLAALMGLLVASSVVGASGPGPTFVEQCTGDLVEQWCARAEAVFENAHPSRDMCLDVGDYTVCHLSLRLEARGWHSGILPPPPGGGYNAGQALIYPEVDIAAIENGSYEVTSWTGYGLGAYNCRFGLGGGCTSLDRGVAHYHCVVGEPIMKVFSETGIDVLHEVSHAPSGNVMATAAITQVCSFDLD